MRKSIVLALVMVFSAMGVQSTAQAAVGSLTRISIVMVIIDIYFITDINNSMFDSHGLTLAVIN